MKRNDIVFIAIVMMAIFGISLGEAQGPCINMPSGSLCSDGNACTISDTCEDGVCIGEQICCVTNNGPNAKCGLCTDNCSHDFDAVLKFFRVEGGNQSDVRGGKKCSSNLPKHCCAPKDQTAATIQADGTCFVEDLSF